MVRYSLTSLLVLVALVGLGCTALLNASPLVAQVVVFVVCALTVAAMICGVFLSGRLRAFASGAALASLLYVTATFAFHDRMRPVLITDQANQALYHLTYGEIKDQLAKRALDERYPVGDFYGYASEPDLWLIITCNTHGNLAYERDNDLDKSIKAFSDLCHALWAFIFGCLGGILAISCRNFRERSSVKHSPRAL